MISRGSNDSLELGMIFFVLLFLLLCFFLVSSANSKRMRAAIKISRSLFPLFSHALAEFSLLIADSCKL